MCCYSLESKCHPKAQLRAVLRSGGTWRRRSLVGGSEVIRLCPSRRKWGHQSCALEGDFGITMLACLPLHSSICKMSKFSLSFTTTTPKQQGQMTLLENFWNCEQKDIFPLNELIISRACLDTAILSALMIMDWTSETVSQPPIKCCPYEPGGGGARL